MKPALILLKQKKGSISPTLKQIVTIIIIAAMLILLYVSIKKAAAYLIPT